MIAGYVTAASLYLLGVAFLAVLPDEWIMSATKRIVSFSICFDQIGTERRGEEIVAIVEVNYTWYGAIVLGAWTATVKFAAWLRTI